MIKIIDLKKTYKTKTGSVNALDGVSLELGGKGFICILGKSGSGKSTLLNILGGLDNFDEGEFIIKDKSFKNFKPRDWDSYRNTYLGFVFQEYNLINNYTIEQNIKIALELQSYPKGEINTRVKEILESVELGDVAKRKPNQLSGGQKQRIAIARALVKNPEIILADEPTGNLDSETGKAIINTLKKLSKEKLVIMVSHDEETANKYADRIIRIKDGKVISDQYNTSNENFIKPEVKEVLKITSENKSDIFLNYKGKLYKEVKNASELNDGDILPIIENITVNDKVTGENVALTSLKDKLNNTFKLIKSKLPFKYSFKLAVSNLFRKKIKLIFTIILFVASLGFFGIAETVTKFDPYRSMAVGYTDSGTTRISATNTTSKDILKNSYDYQNKAYDDNYYAWLDSKNISYGRVYSKCGDASVTMENAKPTVYKNLAFYGFQNFVEVSDFKEMDLDLAYGREPQNSSEVVITDFAATTINEDPSKVVGETLFYGNKEFKVSGIIKTDYESYLFLESLTEYEVFDKNYREYYEFQNEVMMTYGNIFVVKGAFSDIIANQNSFSNCYLIDYSKSSDGLYNTFVNQKGYEKGKYKDIYIDKNIDTLKDNEIIVSIEFVRSYLAGESMDEKMNWSTPYDSLVNMGVINSEINLSFDTLGNGTFDVRPFKIVGVIASDEIDLSTIIISDKELNLIQDKFEKSNINLIVLPDSSEEKYNFFTDEHNKSVKISGTVAELAVSVANFKNGLRKVFNIISLVLAVFAIILMYTLISASVLNKKHEIGTLRSIGARGVDVASIFVIEALLIGLANFVISLIALTFVTNYLNNAIYNQIDTKLAIFNLSPIIIFELLLVSVVISSLSAFLPVKRVTIMKPIDAIKSN